MTHPTQYLTCCCVLLFSASLPLQAATIDFEAQGAQAPSSFDGRLNSPLTVGIATFTGGELLRNEVGGADSSVVYATTNFATGNYSSTLSIRFTQAVSGLSLVLTNQLPNAYVLDDGSGSPLSVFLNANTPSVLSLPTANISTLVIAPATAFQWDYAIDNLTFTVTGAPTPEPAPPLFVVLGAASLTVLRRRLRA